MRTNLITRCYNRLEYTMTCIRESERLAGTPYTHIIIDQGSTDGTKEWLDSIKKEGYYPLKTQYNGSNTGDAGGMFDGYKITDDDCEFIMQMDNDLIPETKDFIKKLEHIMDTDPTIGGIMLKRNGVGSVVELSHLGTVIDNIFLYETKKAYSVFWRKSVFKEISKPFSTGDRIGWIFETSNKIKQAGYKVYKTPDITWLHIDGTYDVSHAKQQDRYPLYFKSVVGKYKNFKNIDYKSI